MKEQIRKQEETIAVLEQELAALRTTADPPNSVALFAAEPIQFVTELEPLRDMSGFADYYPDGRRPEGRRRGTGRNLQARWVEDNPGHARQQPQDAPAASSHEPAPAKSRGPRMAEVDAIGYTTEDPLEAEEGTGGAQYEEDMEEPPPIQDTPLSSNFQHMMNEEELTPAQQEYQSAGQEESAGRQQKRKCLQMLYSLMMT